MWTLVYTVEWGKDYVIRVFNGIFNEDTLVDELMKHWDARDLTAQIHDVTATKYGDDGYTIIESISVSDEGVIRWPKNSRVELPTTEKRRELHVGLVTDVLSGLAVTPGPFTNTNAWKRAINRASAEFLRAIEEEMQSP